MRLTRSRLTGLFASLLLWVAVAGCSAIAPGGGAAQQGVDNKVVTIGLSGILSGANSGAGTQVDGGVKVYLDMLNRNGGVNGYTFKYVERDNANQPAQSVAVAKQLVNEDKVFAIVVISSPGVQALVPIAASLQAPILTSANSDLLQPTIPNVFSIGPRYSIFPRYQADFAIKNLNLKELAYFHEDDAVGQPGLTGLADFVSAEGGRLVAALPFPADATDFAPYASRLKESGAQAVIFGGVNQLASLQKAAAAIGYAPKYLSTFGNLTPDYLKLAGPLAEGVYIASMEEPADSSTPTGQRFIDEMTKADKQSSIGILAGQGWTLGALIEEAVRGATANGTPLTWQSFMNALNSINGKQLGVYPSITFTPDNHTGANSLATFQVQNGTFVTVAQMAPVPQATRSKP